MSARQEFNRMNERLTSRIKLRPKWAGLMLMGELAWIGIIFALIISGLLVGIAAFVLLALGLAVPAIIIRRLKNKKRKPEDQPASEQIINHDEIKTDSSGSPFID